MDATFALEVEPGLIAAFLTEAEGVGAPASELIRNYMRAFVEHRRELRAVEAGVRDDVAQVMEETKDENRPRPAHEALLEDWWHRRAEKVAREGRGV